jgi:hypothetical protein
MISYALAKQLKDVGFPQTSDHPHNAYYGKSGGWPDTVFIPTPSELIEACAPDFDHLVNKRGYPIDGRWWAVSHTREDANGNNPEACGSTAEDAVAKLWLALNARAK